MFSIEEQNFILLGITGNPWFVILPPPYVRRSDNERGKWKRAVLISRPCSTMNESFIIPVPFAEYRVNVTTDLWVKNGNGRPNGKEEPRRRGHRTRDACVQLPKRSSSFQRLSYSGSRRSRASTRHRCAVEGPLHGWKKWQTTRQGREGRRYRPRARIVQEAHRPYKPFYLYAARLIN